MNKKAQLSTEFLIILAIVLVIVLVVISISIFFVESSSEINQKQLEVYWASQASPIRIVQMQGYFYSSSPLLGEIALILENIDSKPITIKSFVLEPYGSETTFNVYANHSTSGSTSGLTLYGTAGPSSLTGLNITFAPGEKKDVYLRTSLACANTSATILTSTEKFLSYFTIYYDTPYFSGLSFKGQKQIGGKCASS
ncbi:MAG: hypothetical protein ACK4J0_01705 [Candidatus Anstonellaceae archaeon]